MKKILIICALLAMMVGCASPRKSVENGSSRCAVYFAPKRGKAESS